MRQMTKTRKMSGIPVNMGKKGQHVKFWNEFGKFIRIKGDHFRFGSVFIKKNNQTEIFLKKKIETRSNRPVSVRFGFLGKKPVQTGLARFFSVFPVFPVLARFFRFGSVFFGFGSFFWFSAYKTETEPNRPVFSKF